MKKYLIPIIAILLFSGSIVYASILDIDQGGTSAGSYASRVLVGYDGNSFIATGTPQLTIGNLLATSTTATSSFAYDLSVAGVGKIRQANGSVVVGNVTGNPRGTNAVDIQGSHSSATMVASGSNSSAFGGDNTCSGTQATCFGFNNNDASGSSAVVMFGTSNTTNNIGCFAIGSGNTCSAIAGEIIGQGITNNFSALQMGPNDTSKLTLRTTGNIGTSGSTTPWAKLSISSLDSTSQVPMFAIGSSSLSVATSTYMIVDALGNLGVGTTSPYSPLSVTGTTSAAQFDAYGTASSTFNNGLNLFNGCYAINGTCLGSGSGTVNTGTLGQLAWYAANGTAVSATGTQITVGNLLSTTTATSTFVGAVGVGTTTPYGYLSVSAATTSVPVFAVGTGKNPLFRIGGNAISFPTTYDNNAQVNVNCYMTTGGGNVDGCFNVKNAGRNVLGIAPRVDVGTLDEFWGNPSTNYVRIFGEDYADIGRLDVNAQQLFFGSGVFPNPTSVTNFRGTMAMNRMADAASAASQGNSAFLDFNASVWDGSAADSVDFYAQAKPNIGQNNKYRLSFQGRNIGGFTGDSLSIQSNNWRTQTFSDNIGINNIDPQAHLDIVEDTALRGGPIVQIKGVSSQTQPYFSILNSAGSSILTATSTGNFGIGTSTPYATTSIQTNSATGDAFVVATSSKNAVFGIDNDGHQFTSGPAPAISSCGTGTGTVVGDDQSGVITTATAATACTMTFAKAYRATPTCTVTDDSLVGFADVSSISTTAVTFGISSALTGGHLYYSCRYHQ